jgi:hypothetical protein
VHLLLGKVNLEEHASRRVRGGQAAEEVTLRLNRGDYIRLVALWVIMLAIFLVLFFIVSLELSGRDGFAHWLSRFFTP